MRDKRRRYITVYAVLILLFFIGLYAEIAIGNVDIKGYEIWDIFLGRGGDSKAYSIIMNIRLPRAFLTMILGGALSVSGFLLQTYFQNPIAGPYILGISSGAKMAVAIVLIFIAGSGTGLSSIAMVFAAFIGALVSTAFIIMISRAVKSMAAILTAGIMLGYIFSAVTDFLVTFAADADIVNLHNWSRGSFSGADAESVIYSGIIVGLAMIPVLLLCRALDALRLGENYAKSVGINVRLSRALIILLSSLLSATVTAFAGPVAFIGIAVPFLMRETLKTSKPIILIPASFIAGSFICMISDLLARMMLAPTEMNISAVTSLFGAPIVIFMILRRRQE